jgi:signal recognition particle subunit SRP72
MSTPPYSVDSLESLLRSLSLSEDTPDHHEILKHANNVLKSSKENPRALHTKVVALLNLDHHEDALKILNSVEGRQLEGIAAIEKAYCLYKVGKLQEAVELTNIPVTSRQSERALKHIAAQAVS